MGYVGQSLGQNETLLYKARFHWLYYVGAWTCLVAFVLLALWSAIYAGGAWTEWIVIGGCMAGLLLLLQSMLPIWTTEIAVTNHRLIVKRGWLSRSTDELQLKAIEQVNFRQGLVGRFFNFGSVDVHGTGMEDLVIPPVAAPLELLKAIEDAASPTKSTAGLPEANGSARVAVKE